MKRNTITVIAMLIVSTVCLPAQDIGRFMRFPDINGNRIVFTYEGDLWLTTLQGGPATRITSHPGTEYAAKFSADGKWIAFTGSYDGGSAVYVIPAEGGEPRRITFTPGGVQTICWAPDGKRVVFRSAFENTIQRDPKLYFVDRDGCAPERLPLDRGTLCSFSPDGKSILYCRKGAEEGSWKRYKGGEYQDIWMYSFETRSFTPISDYVGKNSYPMWVGDEMYFVSDRTNGIANLYAQNLKSKQITQLTTYDDFDVMRPSTDGKNIVFLHNGFLHAMLLPSHEVRRIPVTIPTDKWATRDRYINPKEYVHSIDVANNGKHVVLEARGDIFVAPVEKGNTINISNTPGTREMYPAVSPDGEWVAFFSDKTSEYQLYMQKIEGGEWVQLTTSLDRTNYHPVWSPDGKKVLFGNKTFTIFVVDVASKQLTKIDESRQGKTTSSTGKSATTAGHQTADGSATVLSNTTGTARSFSTASGRTRDLRSRTIFLTISIHVSTQVANIFTISRAGISRCRWISTRTTTSSRAHRTSWWCNLRPVRNRRLPRRRSLRRKQGLLH
jgi:tricorn protease